MSIKISEKVTGAFDGNMQSSSAVELPFACPPFFVSNGDARLEQAGGVHYFGGWACSTEKLQIASESWEDRPFPIPGLTQTDIIVKKNQKLQVLASRNILVAPIGVRQFSTITADDGRKQRVAPFTKGARPGIQVLCILGYKDANKAIQPYMPVMLTASGYQVNHTQDAFANWNKAIKPLIKKLLPNVEPSKISNLFWMSIGTFGTKPNFVSVGKGDQGNTITPISAYIPETLDEKVLETLYVGDDVSEWMADLSALAKDWLQVFRNMTPAKPVTEPEEPHDFDQEPPPPEDDIPF